MKLMMSTALILEGYTSKMRKAAALILKDCASKLKERPPLFQSVSV